MLNVRHVTNNQPFFAGVILLEEGNLVATLNMDGLPSALMKNPAWRVGGVGGGQKAGETIWECALREAHEELCTEVTLRTSQVTYFHDIDTGKITSITCDDPIAPFLLERQSNLFPYGPYRPGLPAGPYTYFGLFLAERTRAHMQPGDDVEALLHIPCERWSLLQNLPELEEVLRGGARLLERRPLPRSGRLWLPPHESMSTVAQLLVQHPELVRVS